MYYGMQALPIYSSSTHNLKAHPVVLLIFCYSHGFHLWGLEYITLIFNIHKPSWVYGHWSVGFNIASKQRVCLTLYRYRELLLYIFVFVNTLCDMIIVYTQYVFSNILTCLYNLHTFCIYIDISSSKSLLYVTFK